jgi:hypothetical protein
MSVFIGRWRRFVLHLMGKEDPPERIAAAFALGVAISFFTPLTGFHTLIALGLAFLLGLSKVDVVMGTFVVNPWTVVPVISFEEWIGKKVLRLSPALAPHLPWREILHKRFWHTLRGSGWHYLAALTVGSVVASALAATATYFLVRGIILRYQRMHPHLSAHLKSTGEFPAPPPQESPADSEDASPPN